MSWHHVFVMGKISQRGCGLHLRQGVPRIFFRPIKPLHMRNEDGHASGYSCPSVFQPHFTIPEAKPLVRLRVCGWIDASMVLICDGSLLLLE
ncbi:hypothetical protein V8C34DRAFT_289672 [Trichoderma compactum]